MMRAIRWLEEPEEHDYPAAESYLGLVLEDDTLRDVIVRLRAAPMAAFKAKDIFRASGLSLLGVSNGHVAKDRGKIEKDKALSPLLLVRQPLLGKVIIADGYHRLCAVYGYDEDALIPCKIA